MDTPGGAAWPAREGPRDSLSIRRDIRPSPTWEPPQKKVRNNNSFHPPSGAYASQDAANHTTGDGDGVFPPRFPHQLPVHAASEQSWGRRENFGPSGGMSPYGGEGQMQSRNEHGQGTSHSTFRNFNTASAPGFPPGSAKSTGALFFKTKLCTKFKLGRCNFNERCHFAHGMEDLRKPPASWEIMTATAGQGGPFTGRVGDGNLQQRKRSSRPCRFFSDGKECPYGDRCTFVHFANEDGYPPPQSVHVANDDGFPAPQSDRTEGGGLAAPRLKTRMCARWERGEACNDGEKCRNAQDYAEMPNESGFSGYDSESAAAVNDHFPSPCLDSGHFNTQSSNPRAVKAPLPAGAPSAGLYAVAHANTPPAAYPATGTVGQQLVDNFAMSQGQWNEAPAQGGFVDNQKSGSWAGHPMADMGFSKGVGGSIPYLPAQTQQPPPLHRSCSTGDNGVHPEMSGSWTGHSKADTGFSKDQGGSIQYFPVQAQRLPVLNQFYSAGNNGVHAETQPLQNVNSVQPIPQQMVPVHMQDGFNFNTHTEAKVSHIAYNSATYLPSPSV